MKSNQSNVQKSISNWQEYINKNYLYIFSSIILFAAILRIWVIYFSGQTWFSFDSYRYLEMADAILAGKPLHSYPNGYPLLIAILKFIIPENLLPLALVTINLICQLTMLIIFEKILIRYKVNKLLILLTVLLITVYPNQIDWTRKILTETISTCLIIITIYFYTTKRHILTGIFGYIISTFRVVMLLFIPTLLLFIIFQKERSVTIKIICGFVIGIVLFLSLEFLGIIAPAENNTINLLLSTKRTMGVDDNYKPADFSEIELTHPFQTYINYAINNPYEFIKKRIAAFWHLWGLGITTKQNTWYWNMLFLIRFPLFIVSCLVFFYRKKFAEFKDLIEILFIPILLITIFHTLLFSGYRFTNNAEPSIIFLTVLGLNKFINNLPFKKFIN